MTKSEDISLRILTASERDEAGEVWRGLESRLPQAGVACSWSWTASFLEAYGRGLRHLFVIGSAQGVDVGAVLLTRSVRHALGRIPVRTIRIGTAGEPHSEVYVEYNRLLVVDEARDAFLGAVVEFAREQKGWDEIRFDGVEPNDAQPLLTSSRWQIRHEPSPVMDLRRAVVPGDLLRLLGKGTRYRVNRSIRSSEPVTGEWALTEDHALDILDELVRLHQSRWEAEGRGAFASSVALEFHRRVIRALIPYGTVVLFRARGANGTIGCIYGFVERGRLLQYQSGFAASTDNKIRNGLMTHVMCMGAALDRGLEAYDFLAGDLRFKRELSNAENTLVWCSSWNSHLRGRLLGRLSSSTWLRHRFYSPGMSETDGTT